MTSPLNQEIHNLFPHGGPEHRATMGWLAVHLAKRRESFLDPRVYRDLAPRIRTVPDVATVKDFHNIGKRFRWYQVRHSGTKRIDELPKGIDEVIEIDAIDFDECAGDEYKRLEMELPE